MRFIPLLHLLVIAHVVLKEVYGDENIRLPKSIIPVMYNIGIVPDLDTGSLEGYVHLNFFVQSATDRIILHGVNLTVIDSSVIVTAIPNLNENDLNKWEPNSSPLEILHPVTYNVTKEFIIIQLASKLNENSHYRLSLNYTGALSQNLKGFYRSDYVEKETGTKKSLGVTQFEPTSARLCFPCMDEPALKATFVISIGRLANYTSLSNMPLRKTQKMLDKDGWFWDEFEKSVPMSTYLVAILVSEFSMRAAKTVVRPTFDDEGMKNVSTTEIRIWAREDAIEQVNFAVEVTPIMLEFLEDYFQVPFPLPKLDLVALPDFSSGAMENWGLITFKEATLLVDPKSAAIKDEMNVARVIAHELAHQWFGNLVTMNWWTDLWLNEGFASYVQRLVLEKVSPHYQYGAQQALSILSVMDADALETSHSISVEVENPTQISEIFDAISYTKGAAVIRMMNDFLGENTFRKGITNYLQQKKYGNAQQDELWQFLTEQAHADSVLPLDVDVKTICDTWTLQMGFPLLTFTRNYNNGSVFISQKHFLRSAAASTALAAKKEEEKEKRFPNYLWWVPISMTDANHRDFSENNTVPVLWLTPKKISIKRRLLTEANQWIIANIRATGYYRVNYDRQNWQLLQQQLKRDHRVIDPINRAHLIDDAFALAAIKTLPYTLPFDLIRYLQNEQHYVPWSSALRSLSFIGRMFSFTKNHGRYKAFMSSLVTPVYLRIGPEFHPEDEPLIKLTRISLIGQACGHEYRPCIRQMQILFDQWMESIDPINFDEIIPDLRGTTYCTAIKFGGQAEWEFAYQMSQNVTSAQHRDSLLSALGCSREPWILMRYLSFILDPNSGIRKQDGQKVIGAVASNALGRRLAFEFVMDHFDQLFSYNGNPVKVLHMLSRTTNSLNTREDLNKLKKFIESKEKLLKSAQTSSNNIQSIVEANVEWMEENYDILNNWFINNGF